MMTLVAALLVAAGPTFAGGGEKGDWELGVYGGYGWLDDYGIFHPKNDLLYGGRVGYFFTPQWSVELSAQRLGTVTDFDLLGVSDVDVRVDAYRLNALYNFGEGNRFRPFLTAGVGREKFSVQDFGEDCDLGFNAGAGFRQFLSPHWNLRADGRYIRTNVGGEIDETQHNLEATLGLGFVFGGGGTETPEPVRTETAPPNQAPTVTCAIERPEILPGESVNVRATASDPEGDPLTYAWSSTAGRVTGDGATASFDFAGTTPPASATITVRVSDGRGNTSSCDNSVRLREPTRPAEAVSCIAGGFARD
ncbi:MAG TPA: outer membrane beta-barrel protein, partial [Candidatus Eisenbacteria bacterium]|nr:outer membrane beta-barrel protein [Candidatus Eisenbacteria bacterium]